MKRGAWLFFLLGLLSFGCLALSDGSNPWPCQTNQDCLHGNVCRENKCLPASFCESDFDCGPIQACQASRCVDVECSPENDLTCLPYWCQDHRCGTSCRWRDDCHGGYSCRDGACVAIECMFGGSECEPYACVEQLCPTSCSNETDCLAGYTCDSGACKPKPCGSNCPPCTTPACVAARCAGLECGMHDSVDCGSCPVDSYCDANQCVTACQTRECGSDHGVDCGPCEVKQYCDAQGQCQPACLGMECGQDHGIECGPCDQKAYCDEGYQCQAVCQNIECGYEHSVLCGNCLSLGKYYCDADQQCQPACDDIACGLSHGVDCGECPGKNYCDLDGQCQPACNGYECGAPFGVDCGQCPDDKACDVGSCVPEVCPKEHPSYCKGDAIWWCHDGVSEELALDCGANRYCYEHWDDDRPGSTCADKCTPHETFCDPNQVHTDCDDNGHPVPIRDCPAESLLCSNPGCGENIFGGNSVTCTQTTSQKALGSVYHATEDVTLLNFGQFFDANGSRFVVYESTALGGPYALVAEASNDFHSPINALTFGFDLDVPLKSGRYYILAVATLDGQDGSFCYAPSAAPEAIWFGELLPVGYASSAALPVQINSPSGPGNTNQTLNTMVLK